MVLQLHKHTHKYYTGRVPARPVPMRDGVKQMKDKMGMKKLGAPAHHGVNVGGGHGKLLTKQEKHAKEKKLQQMQAQRAAAEAAAQPPSPLKRKPAELASAAAAAAAAAATKRARAQPRVDPVAQKLKRFRDTTGMLRPLVIRPRPAAPPASRATDADRQLAAISPELAALRQRMLRLALEHSLTEVSNESVQLMMLALEVCAFSASAISCSNVLVLMLLLSQQHMKNVLSNCDASGRTAGPLPAMPDTTTPPAASTAPAAGAPAPTPTPIPAYTTTTPAVVAAAAAPLPAPIRRTMPLLSTSDLYTALRCGPYLLGEDLALNQERLIAYAAFR